MKICKKCGQLLPYDNFSKEASYKNGYKNICKKCHNLYSKEYRKKQKERRAKLFNKEETNPNEFIGGHRIYILNHIKEGEFKYNVVSTLGDVFHTNNKRDFINFLAEL